MIGLGQWEVSMSDFLGLVYRIYFGSFLCIFFFFICGIGCKGYSGVFWGFKEWQIFNIEKI